MIFFFVNYLRGSPLLPLKVGFRHLKYVDMQIIKEIGET